MKILIFVILFFNFTAGFSDDSSLYLRHGVRPLPTVGLVQVDRYLGKWFVIASLPQFFTKGCKGQTAEYSYLSKNSIKVLNTCFKENKKITTIKGNAVVVNPITKAELEVTFDNFFTKVFRAKGDYNIIQLDPNYRFVMVGSKNRKSLWIMSRETKIPKEVLDQYIDLAKKTGFDVSKLNFSNY